MGYLARLLAAPGREIHALDLAGANDADAGDAGEALDAEAQATYRRRLGRTLAATVKTGMYCSYRPL